MYAPSVFRISWGPWLGLRVTGSDGDAIVDGLEPACNELHISVLVGTTLETFTCRRSQGQVIGRESTYIG